MSMLLDHTLSRKVLKNGKLLENKGSFIYISVSTKYLAQCLENTDYEYTLAEWMNRWMAQSAPTILIYFPQFPNIRSDVKLNEEEAGLD